MCGAAVDIDHGKFRLGCDVFKIVLMNSSEIVLDMEKSNYLNAASTVVCRVGVNGGPSLVLLEVLSFNASLRCIVQIQRAPIACL